MKILVLRIYNPTPAYDAMRRAHEKYEKNKCIYVSYSQDKEGYYPETRDFYVKGEESYLGCLDKTLGALEWCLANLEFDYLIRSNMSTILNLPVIEGAIEKVAKVTDNVYMGFWQQIYKIDEKGGINQEVFNLIKGQQFVNGTSIILGNNMCRYLIMNRHELNPTIVDDVAISLVMDRMLDYSLRLPICGQVIENKRWPLYKYKSSDRMFDADQMEKQYRILA